jgi:hypothetical protein
MRFFNPLILATVFLAVQKGESAITIDPTTCRGVLSGKIQAALVDMGNMARFAHDCTNALQTGTPPQCNPTVLLSTFTAYFGRVTNNDLASRGQTVLCMCFNHFSHILNRNGIVWGCEW